MAILQLQTNIPLTLTPKYADYAPSKKNPEWPPQLKLKTAEGDNVYLNKALVTDLSSLGILTETDDLDATTNLPKLRVLKSQPITILKVDKPKVHTTVTVGGSAAPPQPQRNGAAPTTAPRQPAAPAEPPGVTFERLCLTMGRCLFRAMTEWEKRRNEFRAVCQEIRANGPDWDVIASTAHSLFIAADKRNLLASLPAREPGSEG